MRLRFDQTRRALPATARPGLPDLRGGALAARRGGPDGARARPWAGVRAGGPGPGGELRLVGPGRRGGRLVPLCQPPADRAASRAATLGQEGGAAVRRYCERTTPDTGLLMIAPQLDRKDLKTKWVQEVERVGALVQVWPLEGGRLVAWLGERLRGGRLSARPRGCGPAGGTGRGQPAGGRPGDREAEAPARPGPTGRGGSAGGHLRQRPLRPLRSHRCLPGRGPGRVARVMGGLVGEGTAAPLVLWVLARELRLLAAAAFAQAQGQDPPGPWRSSGCRRCATRPSCGPCAACP